MYKVDKRQTFDLETITPFQLCHALTLTFDLLQGENSSLLDVPLFSN